LGCCSPKFEGNSVNFYGDEFLNCGICEKCIRTKLHLLALGYSEKARSFQNKYILPEEIEDKLVISESTLPYITLSYRNISKK
jgi:hypothetical protein